ncbi:NAD(+) synthase [Jiella sp. M17.18]|uniref:NAD(+) synthase n=1 Tax=Jiella sp. M17.18 TaxID=3234247 RepID=UPI0034DE4552
MMNNRRAGFVRVATATPKVALADPAGNCRFVLDLVRQAEDERCDLVIFPELCMSGYAIDDLHLQEALLSGVEAALATLKAETAEIDCTFVVGAPIRRNGRVYNAALVFRRGTILGAVPKVFLPNYREFYEKRWFASGHGLRGLSVTLAGEAIPFGPDLVFRAANGGADEGAATAGRPEDFCFHLEICEDFWGPAPPSNRGALAGATILCNLSASNITVGKAADREILCASQSMRCMSAYVYSAAGAGESTTDLAWDGQGSIHELGDRLARSERFADEPRLAIADVDVMRIRQERQRTPTFNDAAAFAGHPEEAFRTVSFDWAPRAEPATDLKRPLRRFPYVPNDPATLDQDCYESFEIQVDGLKRRAQATPGTGLVIGISGGLDSTHALIVAAKACDRLGIPRKNILGFTMPGFATGETTKSNAWRLMEAFGITAEEIDIRPAARQMLADMGHPFAKGEPVYDVTFENVQAGLRTDYLFRLANQRRGFVLGTGDLSELALGWCTYGVGDQMSHYAVNAGVPKTLIQHLIRWSIATRQFEQPALDVLADVLDTEISPELVPADADGKIQSTQDMIGPYELHDFFLFHMLRYGMPPSKIAYLAWQAWRDREAGDWPANLSKDARNQYDQATILRWLRAFLRRFFAAQFKRSAIPNGVKVSAGGSLSPRGDWRMPSDATAAAWLAELDAAYPDEG